MLDHDRKHPIPLGKDLDKQDQDMEVANPSMATVRSSVPMAVDKEQQVVQEAKKSSSGD